MENSKAVTAVVNHLQIEEHLNDKTNADQFEMLVEFIDDLIQNDFNRLLSILYRIDISEEKLKLRLAENKESKTSSAEIIAKLFIEREEEKIISRAKYSGK